ncbi:SusC/RagA family TonB-linked outer membrane protein [Parapedobacter deserti]|uniref:SusC/RagA family TonB-linked outer membrane protein n=1 Tax=Parapedobacter deserti TaxID=1912957 RepID=A0ABV7JV10_9SPHI
MMKHFFIFLGSLLIGQTVLAQTRTVSGRVTDGEGHGVSGVSILEKGTSNQTVSDGTGNYLVTMAADQAVLVFSFMGMETQETPVNGRERIDIQLQPSSAIDMDEVVVVGYGVQKKSDVISSVVSVNTESVNKVPSNDLGEMLRGKAAGVYVTVADAAPGSSSNILIRGSRSLTAGNAPIVIADGVPVGGINDINPNDIASIEILKDAAAQAIYGARASNGVILITTKRGREGRAVVALNSFYGAQTVRRNFDVYSGEEFAQLKREAYRADNNNNYLPDEAIFTAIEQEVLESGAFVDWEKELLRVAATQNHNLSVSTGTDKTQIYSGFNYSMREGVVPGTDFQRGTIRLNVDQTINNWLKLGANTSWQLSKNNNPGTGETLLRSITTSPLGKIYNDDGTYRIYPTGVQESVNPLLDLAEVSNTRHDRNDIMNIFADITPFRGLNYRINASRRSWNRKTLNYSTAESLLGYRRGGMGNGAIQYEDEMEWQLENILNYNTAIHKHSLGGTLVHSLSQRKYRRFRNDASNIPNDLLDIYGLPSAERNLPTVGANDRGLVSFVARLQYDYDGKYYATASARADGSTVFGANNKWAYFPAVAVGWNLYRESFIEAVPEITNLRLRASYGSVGNEAIGTYQSMSTAVQRDYLFNGVKRIGYVPGDFLPNPNLKWETSTTLNTALDFGFFKNRLSGTFEFYNTRTTDLLAQLSLKADIGYSQMLRNIGEVENQGIELTMNGIVVDKNDLTVNAGVSFSRNRNKIISLYGERDEHGNEVDDVANGWFIGRSKNVYYQYLPDGIWQIGEDIVNSHMPNAQPGDVKIRDANGDGRLTDADRVIVDRDPRWFGTFNFEVRYRGFDVSADVLAVQGVTRNNQFLFDYSMGGSLRGILNGVKVDYWTPENPSGTWPRPQESNDRAYIWTMGLQDASYVRLHTATLGYTFAKTILSRMKLSNLRIYCTGHNLITLTDYKSYSPEKNPNDYPEAISIVGGIQVNF